MRFFRSIVLTFLLVSLAGCQETNTDDLKNFIDKEKRRPSAKVRKIPMIKPIQGFKYSASNLRSPFVAESLEDTASEGPNTNRKRGILEAFSLDTLKMVGTLTQDHLTWGLIIDKSGIVYRVQPGDYMGLNSGKITRITQERIFLVELIPDGQGGWRERSVSLGMTE